MRLFVLLFCALALPVMAAPQRVVSAGGTVTEIIFALGEGYRVVGVDVSSVYPETAQKRPSVGYVRQLSAEGVLSLSPEVLLTTADAGPPAVLEQLGGAGVRVEAVPAGNDWDAAKARIRYVAGVLGVPEKAKGLENRLDASRAKTEKTKPQNPARVLFIYARGAGALAVSGTDTEADAIIALAGGTNAVTAYHGYRPLTVEALVAAKPDLVLLTTRGLESLGGKSGLAALPGMAQLPSVRVEAVDDLLLLGFGPRLGEAVETLAALLPKK